MSLAISIVVYHNGEELQELINCILSCTLPIRCYLVDNSKTDQLRSLASDPRIIYIFNNANLGYGPGHNIALNLSMANGYKYHLVMNPDISFTKGTLEKIYNFMEINPDIGSLMPKIHYANGNIQRLCKLLPSPGDLILRRFLGDSMLTFARNKRYELHDFDYNSILNIPCLSGCFMFLRTSSLKQTGLFDERFFMYLEDYDLNRRINRIAKTIFFPGASITHLYDKGSYKKANLLAIHIISAIKYFNKWGWWKDSERKQLNIKVLQQIGRTT